MLPTNLALLFTERLRQAGIEFMVTGSTLHRLR
jgi:hypothetical protein